jgi:protoporphyrin/coproporphyrin ferrochelatase
VAVPPKLPFDAVLLIAFGGPAGPDEIRPFLQNVLRNRRVPAERLEEVVHHYARFGGKSPIAEVTRRQADGLAERLRARDLPLPVYVGMRNWRPLLPDTLARMAQDRVSRSIGVLAAAHRSYSSCGQYKQNVWQAQEETRERGCRPSELVYAGDWHIHAGFVEAVADLVTRARARLSEALRAGARLVFTAHSIPAAMPHAETYQRQLRESAAAIADRLRTSDWAIAYQSRSGRPEEPWLEPDINDYLREARRAGLQTVIIAPLGFVADHIEVLYDLDVEARATCAEIGLTMTRAAAVNDHPRFLDALADTVARLVHKYRSARPLPLLPADLPGRREPPPPVRPD